MQNVRLTAEILSCYGVEYVEPGKNAANKDSRELNDGVVMRAAERACLLPATNCLSLICLSFAQY